MDKIKLGIIGVGNMGTAHCNNVLEGKCPEVEITAVADINPQRLEWAEENISGVKTFDNAEEMLGSGLINSVIVSPPLSAPGICRYGHEIRH